MPRTAGRVGQPVRQRRALDLLTKRLQADGRILAMLAVGSIARGQADAVSDLDLLMMIEGNAYPRFWREREAYFGDIFEVVYANDETRPGTRIGVRRMLVGDGLMIEICIFAEGADVAIRGPHRVIFERTDSVRSIRRKKTAPKAPPRLLPGGMRDLPFALYDISKYWARGKRKLATRLVGELARDLGQRRAHKADRRADKGATRSHPGKETGKALLGPRRRGRRSGHRS